MAHEQKSNGTEKTHTGNGVAMDVEFSLRGVMRGSVSADQAPVEATVQASERGAATDEGAGFTSAEAFPTDLLDMIEMRTAGTRKAVVPVARVIAAPEGAANPWVRGEDPTEAQGELVVTVRRSAPDRLDHAAPIMPLRDFSNGGGKMTTESATVALKQEVVAATPITESTLPFGHLLAEEAGESTFMGEELAPLRDKTPSIADEDEAEEEMDATMVMVRPGSYDRVEQPMAAEEAEDSAESRRDWPETEPKATWAEEERVATEWPPVDHGESTLMVAEAPTVGEEYGPERLAVPLATGVEEAAAVDYDLTEGDYDMGKKKADKEKSQENLEGHDIEEAELPGELTVHDEANEADETPVPLAAREEMREEEISPTLASLVDKTPHLAAKSGGVPESYAPAKVVTSDHEVKRGLVDLLNDLGSKKPETENGGYGAQTLPSQAVVAAPVKPVGRQIPVESLGTGVANVLGDGVRAVAAVGKKVTGNGVTKATGAVKAPSSVTRSAVHGSSRDVGTGLRGVVMGVKQVGLGVTSMVTGTMGCLVGAVVCVGQSIAGGFKEAIGKQPSEID